MNHYEMVLDATKPATTINFISKPHDQNIVTVAEKYHYVAMETWFVSVVDEEPMNIPSSASSADHEYQHLRRVVYTMRIAQPGPSRGNPARGERGCGPLN